MASSGYSSTFCFPCFISNCVTNPVRLGLPAPGMCPADSPKFVYRAPIISVLGTCDSWSLVLCRRAPPHSELMPFFHRLLAPFMQPGTCLCTFRVLVIQFESGIHKFFCFACRIVRDQHVNVWNATCRESMGLEPCPAHRGLGFDSQHYKQEYGTLGLLRREIHEVSGESFFLPGSVLIES